MKYSKWNLFKVREHVNSYERSLRLDFYNYIVQLREKMIFEEEKEKSHMSIYTAVKALQEVNNQEHEIAD